jgi:hypothetical protein
MNFFDPAFFDANFFDTVPGEPGSFPFVLSLPSVTNIKATSATPVVQITYQ